MYPLFVNQPAVRLHSFEHTELGQPQTPREPTHVHLSYSPFPKSTEVAKFRYDALFLLYSTPKLFNYLRKAVCLKSDDFLRSTFPPSLASFSPLCDFLRERTAPTIDILR